MKAKRKLMIDFTLVEVLACFTILLQYIVIMTFETGQIGSESHLSGVISAICCAAYFTIAFICKDYLRDRDIAIILAGSIYLFLRTIISGSGFVTMFNCIELVIAVTLFSRIKLPHKSMKHICLFSVALYLIVLMTSKLEGALYVNRIIQSVHINRNHFGILTVVNMHMALAYLRKSGRKLRLSYLAVYAIGFAVIWYSTSRTSLVCVIVFILFHILSVKVKSFNAKWLFRIFVVSVIVSLISVLILTYVVPAILGPDFKILGRSLLSGREKIYSDALDTLIRDGDWLFGRGVSTSFTESLSIYGTVRTNAHNQWLQFTLNYGLVYVAIVLYAYFSAFKRVIGKNPDRYAVMLTFMQMLFFVYFMTEAPHFFRSYSCVYLAIYFTNCMSREHCGVINKRRIYEKHSAYSSRRLRQENGTGDTQAVFDGKR